MLIGLKNTLICTFLLIQGSLFCQERTKTEIGFSYSQGPVLAHHPSMNQVLQGIPQMINISWQKNTFGEKAWQKKRKTPSYGLHVGLVNYQNPQELGYSIHGAAFLQFYLYQSKQLQIPISTSWGLGYVTHVFDAQNNPKNQITSQHVNAVGLGKIGVHWQVLPKTLLGAEFQFFHLSNGSLKKPNQGYNIPMLGLKIAQMIGKSYSITPDTLLKQEDLPRRKINVSIQTQGGIKQSYPIGSPIYACSSLGVLFQSTQAQKNSWQIGIEAFYNASLPQEVLLEKKQPNTLAPYRIGIPIYYQYLVGKTALIFGTGIYVWDNSKTQGKIFHRVGVGYQPHTSWQVKLQLKTHFAQADYFELGLSYIIPQNKSLKKQ